MYSAQIDLTPYLQTKIYVFVADPQMRKHVSITLQHMGFSNFQTAEVPSNYFEALNRLVPILAGDTELILMNLPSKPYPAQSKDSFHTIYDIVDDNYRDLKSLISKRNVDPLKLLCKALPLIEVGDYLREKLIES